MNRQLYLDLDGVLADFDRGYLALFGHAPDRNGPEPADMWKRIDAHGSFFRSLPPMSDALDLWTGAHRFHNRPIILTGLPTNPGVEEQKRAWVKEWIAEDAHVICCRSANKRNYCQPGDVLVDDWLKYAHLWAAAGGLFVHHTSAQESLRHLEGIFRCST